MSILDDIRLISGSADNSIIIYNKITYQPDLIINEHKGSVNYIIQLNSGIIATCSNNKTIKLFKIKEDNYNIIQTLNSRAKDKAHFIKVTCFLCLYKNNRDPTLKYSS